MTPLAFLQTADPAPAPAPIVSLDLSGLGSTIVNALLDGVRQMVQPIPTDLERWAVDQLQGVLTAQGPYNLLTHIPIEWTARNPDVLALYRLMLVPLLGSLTLALSIHGYRVMTGRVLPWDVLVRCGLHTAAAFALFTLGGPVLGLVNAASDAVAGSPPDIQRQALPSGLLAGALLIIALFVSALAWLRGAVGVLHIALLLVVGPFLFVLALIPRCDGLVEWWVKEALRWTLRPVFVAVLLRIGLGLSLQAGDTALSALFAIVAFWSAYKIDGALASLSAGAWGTVGQLGLASRGARMAAAAFGGGAGAPAVAAASAVAR